MSKLIHRLSIVIYVLIVLAAIVLIGYYGSSYYQLNIEERFYHADHQILKSSGMIVHGLGIIGSLLIFAGVFLYMARKRIALFSRIGILKYWLEFHIFLCVLGPVLVLYHTAFKFGGLVAISFWSMVAVVLSGIIGRFIYIQIPRTIEGRLSISCQEIIHLKLPLFFGQKAMDVIMESYISLEIKEKLKQATKYAEGRGIRIDVKNDSK